MADKVSAIPGQLINYAGWGARNDPDLESSARTAVRALEALNMSGPDPSILRAVTYDNANNMIGFAVRSLATDRWVGQVGQAFLDVELAGLPPQMRAQYMTQLLNSTVTADQSQISGVGDDPTATAQDQADAAMLAAQMQEAIDTGNQQQVQQIIQQQLAQHQNDPTFTSEFFQQLGPDSTLKVVSFISPNPPRGDMPNPLTPQQLQLLGIFDTSLAMATNSSDWDPSFNTALWPPLGSDHIIHTVTWDQALLLQYGTYSEDFLTKAGDDILFETPRQWTNANLGTIPGDLQARFDTMFMEALSRNPNASVDYLLGHYGGQGQDRLTQIMDQSWMEYTRGGSDNPFAHAIGDAIQAAGTSPYSSYPYSGSDKGWQVLLHDVAGFSNDAVPDGIRPALAAVLSYGDHMGAFVGVMPSHDGSWSWQQTIFKYAEETQDGHIDWNSVSEVQTAVANWANAHIPGDLDMTVNTPNNIAWQTWSTQVGNLFGLTALPIRTSGYDQAAITRQQDQVFSAAFDFVPVPGGPIVSGITNNLANFLFDNLNNANSELAADKNAAQMYYQQAMFMREDMTARFLAQHPELGYGPPGSAGFQAAVQRIAGEQIASPGDPDKVSQFVYVLNTASDQFAQSYGTPTTH